MSSNIWNQFKNLLPKKKQMIGTVDSVNSANKTCAVILLNGNTIIVGGSGSVGTRYLIEDGVIKEELPDLPVFNKTIY